MLCSHAEKSRAAQSGRWGGLTRMVLYTRSWGGHFVHRATVVGLGWRRLSLPQ